MPFQAALEWYKVPKFVTLFVVRFTLGIIVVVLLGRFCRQIAKLFGSKNIGLFFRCICISQFHLLFYASRPLPNIFALIGVLLTYSRRLDGNYAGAIRIAAATAVVFRCDLALLFGPMFILDLLTTPFRLFGWKGAIWNGMLGAVLALAITVPIDSFFWQRWLWPEGEVWWFNVINNRSHEYGISPWHWYFTSALPRALLTSLVFVPLAPLFDRRVILLQLPVLCFVCGYSLLPHKELRFIIYAIPILNLSAAVVCAKSWSDKKRSWLHRLMAYGFAAHLVANLMVTGVFLYASGQNYPGGDALAYLQRMHRFDENKPRSVHVDVFCAQSGVSRFLHLYDAWRYDKTENASNEYLSQFDFLLFGSATGGNLSEIALGSFSASHRVLFSVEAFHRVQMKRSGRFPFIWPVIRFRQSAVVLKNLNTV